MREGNREKMREGMRKKMREGMRGEESLCIYKRGIGEVRESDSDKEKGEGEEEIE